MGGLALIVGIRGATTVTENTKPEIIKAAQEMVTEIMCRNSLTEDDFVSLLFTVTPDLDAAFPAEGIREMGICSTPLMCAVEIPVRGSLARCIRVLVHSYGVSSKRNVKHVYLRDAVRLRADLAGGETE